MYSDSFDSYSNNKSITISPTVVNIIIIVILFICFFFL